MTEWYRNTDWNEEIAADFEKRLARSRGQKVQNLSLQGYHLLAKHPAVARTLLERAVAMNDPFETHRALSFLALAHVACGDIDLALDLYEDALKRQAGQPGFVAVQPSDYLFLVGMFQRADRLATALPLADMLPDEGMFGIDPQSFTAKALIMALADRGEEARRYAQLALPFIRSLPESAALGLTIADVRSRLERLAGSGA